MQQLITRMLVLAVTFAPSTGLAGDEPGVRPAPPRAGFTAPKLIVLIVIDQLRGDYFEGCRTHFGRGGFERLIRDGAYFVNTAYSHGSTATGPGHACIATGANPRIHGIAANADEHGECSQDERFPVVGL
ncbi:MAG: alkaline phosphatase family protein, partial [Phycisphaerae bacterium]